MNIPGRKKAFEPIRGESRTAATSKMECFVIIVNDKKPLSIITKRSVLDVVAVLDPPLLISKSQKCHLSDLKNKITKIYPT